MGTCECSAKRNIGVGAFATTPKMRGYINQVLDSGRLSYGPMSRQFEQRFSNLHECKFGVLSNSGTSSLQVALQAMKELYGWDDGDEVIVPSVTFVATVNIVLHNRMKPVLVDIDDEFFELDPERLERAITPRTRAVIPVHLFGLPCAMTDILGIAYRRHLRVIEDSCECMGVEYQGRSVGSLGDIGCFSLYVAHLLTAGVGGVATTNDPDLAVKMRSLVNHGRDSIYLSIDDDNRATEEVIARRFNFESVGHSYRITELEAALALAQLDDLPDMIKRRTEIAEYLCDHIGVASGRLTTQVLRGFGTGHANMMLPLVYTNAADKWPLCNYLEARGIETRECLRLTDQPCYRGMWNPKDYPVAEWMNKSGFYVACHDKLTDDDVEYMCGAFTEWFKEH